MSWSPSNRKWRKFRRFFCKFLLEVTSTEATRACEPDQLHGGLEAEMKGAMHHTRSLWDQNFDKKEDYGFLFIDTRNAFNKGNRKMTLHASSRHEWSSGARFLFNPCRNHSILIMIREKEKMIAPLHSKEGVIQGCLSSIIGPAIFILPILRQLKADYANHDTIWCAGEGNDIRNIHTINLFLSAFFK